MTLLQAGVKVAEESVEPVQGLFESGQFAQLSMAASEQVISGDHRIETVGQDLSDIEDLGDSPE